MADQATRFQRHLLGAIEDLTEALNKEAPAPEVNVDVPAATPPKVDVTVEAPPIPPAPDVTIDAPVTVVNEHCAFEVEVTERDTQNFIKKLKITPA